MKDWLLSRSVFVITDRQMTPNQSLQPTPVSVVSSADAGHVVVPAWLSLGRSLQKMEFRPVSKDEFWRDYQKAFEKVDVPTEADEDALRERIFGLQEELVKNLGAKWKKGKDFEIEDDYDFWFHVCGGIYSRRSVCADLLKQVRKALATDATPEIWTFHAAVESPWIDGQFFVRGETVVFPDDGPDFGRLLRRRFALW